MYGAVLLGWIVSDGEPRGFVRRTLGKLFKRRPTAREIVEAAIAQSQAWGAEVRLPPRRPLLSFRIAAVHRGRRLLEGAPWHDAGGPWTIADVEIDSATRAPMTIGWLHGPEADVALPFGQGLLAAPEAASGARVLEAFVSALGTEAPPARADPRPIERLLFRTVVFGTDLAPRTDGGLGGTGGGILALKWMLDAGGHRADVQVHVDVARGTGVFVERDGSDAAELLAALAIVLRDGPPPSRTPETDPTLSMVGPRFVDWHPAGRAGADPRGWSPGGEALLMAREEDGRDVVEAWRPSDGSVEELALVDGLVVRAIALHASARRLLVWEMTDRNPSAVRLGRTESRLLLREESGTLTELRGGWGERRTHFASSPVSPDGAFVAITAWRPQVSGRRMYQQVFLFRIATGSAVCIDVPDVTLDVLGWQHEGGAWRAVVAGGSEDDEERPAWFADPSTGSLQEAPAGAAAAHDRLRSPDGRFRLHVVPARSLELEETATGARRAVAVHPQDRRALDRAALDWCGPRHVLLEAERPVLLDVETLAWSFPMEEGAPYRRLMPDPTGCRVAAKGPEGVVVAAVR